MPAFEEVIFSLPGGKILALSDGEIIRARGIPYAHAKRFQKPEIVTTWDGIQDCTKPASVCHQNPSRLWPVFGEIEKGNPQSEDCQHVTVAAPTSASNAPVMVFFHGGAYVSGGGDVDAYSPHGLARKGVVAVNVTHRLGIFGFMPIPGVAPPNLSILDQIASLEWVQSNIHAFGGDPKNVTLYGQSAGADTIYCLCASGIADHLFQRGIMQSTPFARYQDSNRDEMLRKMSEHASKTLLAEGPETVSVPRLLELTKELMGIARATSNSLLPYGPVFGEHPFPPEDGINDQFIASAKRKGLMIGYTAQEETAFAHIDSREGAPEYLCRLFQGSSDEMIQKMGKELGKPPVSYEVLWYPKGSEQFKATHCLELSLLLGDWEAWKNGPMLAGEGAEEALGTLGESVKNFWIDFAKGHDLGSKRYVIDGSFTWPQ